MCEGGREERGEERRKRQRETSAERGKAKEGNYVMINYPLWPIWRVLKKKFFY